MCGLAGDRAGQGRFLAGGGVAVDDAAAHGPIEDADGLEHGLLRLRGLLGRRRARRLHRRPEGAAPRAVAQAPLQVLLDPLPGGAGVGHGDLPLLAKTCVKRVTGAWVLRARNDSRWYRPCPRLSRTLSP